MRKTTTIYFSVSTPGRTITAKAHDVIACAFAGARAHGAEVEPTPDDLELASHFRVDHHEPGGDPTEVKAVVSAEASYVDRFLKALKQVE